MKGLISTIAALSISGAVVLSAIVHPRPLLIWNATPSVPTGLYRIETTARLAIGDLVVVKPPVRLANWLAQRRYVPLGVPLIKHVVALSGATVCRHGATVSISGIMVATALDHDRVGRPLPRWEGCVDLRPGDVFLMNLRRPDSLDGRYFAALPVSSIVGRAILIWTRERR
jgi:conjugative transfer signal peptidase TraF